MSTIALKKQLRAALQLKLSRLDERFSKAMERLAIMEIEMIQTRDDLARLDAEINEVKTDGN